MLHFGYLGHHFGDPAIQGVTEQALEVHVCIFSDSVRLRALQFVKKARRTFPVDHGSEVSLHAYGLKVASKCFKTLYFQACGNTKVSKYVHLVTRGFKSVMKHVVLMHIR